MSKIATFVKDKDGNGKGKVYRLSVPIVKDNYGYEPDESFEYVWVSAVTAMCSGPETFIFGCDENGEVLCWGELDGSYRGGLDHDEALRGAGYEPEYP